MTDNKQIKTTEQQEENLPVIELNTETQNILNQLMVETNVEKTKDLTYLFNQNQNKKTMVRMDKLSQLMDTLTEQAIKRFQERPDELANKEIFDGLKVLQDVLDKSNRQIAGANNTTPLIQINQQTNEVNVGQTQTKESRERVMNAVNEILKGIVPTVDAQPPIIHTEEYTDDEQN